MFFRMLYDDMLAQASYLIGCQRTGEAIVIDPERDIERYLALAKQEGLSINSITETHIHADFLSGSREFAERTGGFLYLSDEGHADWKYRWLDKKKGGGAYPHKLLKHGDVFRVGNIRFEVVHTPGHTPEHISFIVTDTGGGADEPMGIATGDFVFVGDVGRPDLLETAAGHIGVKEGSAKELYKSLQKFKNLPDYLQVWPGHGAGSACGKALGAVPQSTVGYEKRFNAAISGTDSEAGFVASILHGQPEPPYYFARMKRENRDGPPLLGALPAPAAISAQSLDDILKSSPALVDIRPWTDFSAGHLPGALYAPLGTALPMVAGSYIEPGVPIYLIANEADVEPAVKALIRIGLDEIAGFITPEVQREYTKDREATARIMAMDITQFQNPADGEALVLDVRRADEFEAGHLPGAVNVAHTRLLPRLNELPQDRPIYVHCHTSNRSAYATAMLQRHGYAVTMLTGGFKAWSESGGKIVREEG